ncbi:rhamnosyltransferase WsaF family glycosyltransferase [Allochromatium vinosum]|uniref:rhamnosyltransferase WsaF family glycosyltransferase n=1 Tax=Allochromatium vinosum TaxID=1049 RepID=UPI001F5B2A3C|nr:glycosyltransferase [Allochromatium vinosum]
MLQQAQALERSGHSCILCIEGVGSEALARRSIRDGFGYTFDQARFGWTDIPPVDVVVATIWYSAAIACTLPFPCRKVYFVQDYEAWFSPIGDNFLMAEASYRLGLTPITIGRWLKHELERRFQTPALHFDFGADLATYRPQPQQGRELAVCFLYQPEKPRRCARIGLNALAIVKHRRPDVKIILYGSGERGKSWVEHEHLGLLSVSECGALYGRCAVGLSLSPSNPSRVPFEMMAAGLPVVELWRETTIHDFPDDGVILAEPAAEALAEAMLCLLADETLRQRMGTAGAAFMANRGVEIETQQFVANMELVLAGGPLEVAPLPPPLYRRPPITVGARVGDVPGWLKTRLNAPPNAVINVLPPLLRRLAGFMGRLIRRMAESR